jgi:hypothetical protein
MATARRSFPTTAIVTVTDGTSAAPVTVTVPANCRNRDRLTTGFNGSQAGIPKGMPVLLETGAGIGAGGFVGSALVAHLDVTQGGFAWALRLDGAARSPPTSGRHRVPPRRARACRRRDDPAFLHDNVDKTLALARAARVAARAASCS